MFINYNFNNWNIDGLISHSRCLPLPNWAKCSTTTPVCPNRANRQRVNSLMPQRTFYCPIEQNVAPRTPQRLNGAIYTQIGPIADSWIPRCPNRPPTTQLGEMWHHKRPCANPSYGIRLNQIPSHSWEGLITRYRFHQGSVKFSVMNLYRWIKWHSSATY